MRVLTAVLLFATLVGSEVKAQTTAPTGTNPPLLIFVDTAGVSGIEDVYSTWVFSRATPTSWPSSGVLVSFDCRKRLVRRLAHVVYSLKADSSGVEGPIYPDSGGWVKPSIPKMMDLVCQIGPTHMSAVIEPTHPETPKPEELPDYQVS